MKAILRRIAPLIAMAGLAVIGLALVGLLHGCAKTERAIVDPKAFSFWVVPF